MSFRIASSAAAAAALIASAVVSLSAQTPLRTLWGDPDLQGFWPTGAHITVPFERPVEFGTRSLLTEDEFKARAAALDQQAQADRTEVVAPGTGGSSVNAPSHWLEAGRASRQASLIVDPADGRLPPMTDEGASRAKAWPSLNPPGGYARAQEFNIYDRCITRGILGSTMPNIYNSGIEIIQAPGLVVIRYEMVHETRVIPLDGRPHLASALRSYMGDSRGRWDNSTLVVETTNLNGKTGSYGRNGNGNPLSEAARLIERFTRRDENTLDYAVTVDDPRTWTKTWTIAFPIARAPGYEFFEYACHEGNYSIANMLRAARAMER